MPLSFISCWKVRIWFKPKYFLRVFLTQIIFLVACVGIYVEKSAVAASATAPVPSAYGTTTSDAYFYALNQSTLLWWLQDTSGMSATLSLSSADPSIASISGRPLTLPAGYGGPFPPSSQYDATLTSGTRFGATTVSVTATHTDGSQINYHSYTVYVQSLDVLDASSLRTTPQFDNNGTLSPIAATALSGSANQAAGIAADGVATLLLRLNMALPGRATFTINGSGDPTLDGKLYDPVAGGTGNSSVTVSNSGMTSYVTVANNVATSFTTPQAYILYQAPINFTNQTTDTTSQRTISINVSLNLNDGSPTQTFTQTFTLVRPPIVLVHGLWSDSSAWNQFAAALKGISGAMVFKADYRSAHAASFGTNSLVVEAYINQAIKAEHANGIASIQADVVGHSMGGLLARIWTENPYLYKTSSNYNKGDIHKLITIDSPHLGSFAADAILQYESSTNPLKASFESLMALNDSSVTAGAIKDLGSSSDALKYVNSSVSNVPSYSITGYNSSNVSCGYNFVGLVLAKILFTFDFPTSSQPNDTVVTVSSQTGGLPNYQTASYNFCHTDIEHESTVATEVKSLLNSAVSAFAPGFPKQ